jgi:hypothetical protein
MEMEASKPNNGAVKEPSRNEEYRKAFGRLVAAERAASARGGVAVLASSALAAFSALLAAERLAHAWRFFPLLSFAVFWGAIAAGAAVAARGLVPVSRGRRLAGEIDRRFGGNLVEAALDFSGGEERVESYSPFLVAATIRRAAERLRAADPRALFASASRPGWTLAGTFLGVLVAIQVALSGGDPGAVLPSLVDPVRSFRAPYRYNLVAVSLDRSVLPGESVTAEAVNFGSLRGPASLLTSAVPGVWKSIEVPAASVPGDSVEMCVYRHVFGDVREDFTYAFSAGGARTRDVRVTVIHRPVINDMTAVLVHPGYTRAKADTIQPLTGKIAALAGTRVSLSGRTSKPVRAGWVRFASGAKTPVAPAPGGFRAAFSVSGDDTFSVEAVDSLGYANDHPVKYPIAALEDRPPAVELYAPEDGAQLPRSLEAELVYRASDDYGISRLALFFMRDGKDEGFRSLSVPLSEEGEPPLAALTRASSGSGRASGPLTEIDGRYVWSLAGTNVFPGDRILYYLEVTDNNTATGPGRARTATRRLVVPSVAEIYARIHQDDSKREEDLAGALDKGREIRERLRKLSDELKARGELDWSRKRESGEILEKQRELRDNIDEIASQIDKSLETIEKNRAASQEVGRKVEEIQRLLRQIESDELRAAIEKLQTLMTQVPASELTAAMNEVQLDAQKLVENMDRTIELLKQVIKEEKMDELVRRLDDLLKEQTALRDSTAGGETQDLAKKQDELGFESEAYEKDFDEFAEGESDSSLAALLDSMRDEIDRSGMSEDMKRAAEQLSADDRAGARSSQQNAIDDMLSLFTSLSSCQMSMGLTMDAEVARIVGRSTRELVEASKLQEAIVPKVLGRGGRASAASLIDDELVVKTALEAISRNLYDASRATMSLSPKIFSDLGLARKEVETALSTMEEERTLEASEASARAYRAMNLAAIELLRSSVSSGGAGGSGRQRMQQLLQRQMSLRQELQRLLERGGSGQWSMEERASMARLAAEQRAMGDLMRQIAEESRGTNELLGAVDDLSDKMEGIARNLDEGKLDRDVIDRQQEILSRMLESQRSMRERDYKQERRSTPAGDVKALAPDAWRKEIGDEDVLLKMIRRAMQEKGPAEYEELIRLYFRALSEKARETK